MSNSDYYDSETEEIMKLMESNLNTDNSDWKASISVLSEEFDMLGLSTIDLDQSSDDILQQVSDNSLSVIQLYRNLLAELRDVNINNKQNGTKNNELEKKLNCLNDELKRRDDKNKLFENKVLRLTDECSDLKKQIAQHEDEIKRIKRYYKTKQNELNAHINKLKDENQHLKEICGRSIGQYFSKDQTLSTTLNEYKRNEEIYKETIQQLETNNNGLILEVFNLKEQLDNQNNTLN